MTPAEAARARFETFAAMDSPDLPDDEIDAIQVRLHRWQVRNFGPQSSERQVLGIIEELGELEEALGGDDPELIYDAVGDICVFSSQLLNMNRMAISEAFKWIVGNGQPLIIPGARLAHVVLKRAQRIRGMDDDEHFRAALLHCVSDVLATAAYGLEREPRSIFCEVAETVMKRTGSMLPGIPGDHVKRCAGCGNPVDSRWWADVPGAGDLCVTCHDARFEGPAL